MRNFIFVLLGLTYLLSCKKTDAFNPNLIVGKWKMSGYIYDGIDVLGIGLGLCVKDDIITFSNGNILSADAGLLKCHPTDPQTITGTYSVNSSQTILTFSINSVNLVDSILTLNNTTLKFKQLDNNDVLTYNKQP